MTFAYYPGCSAKASTRELDIAVRWLAHTLGLDLLELVEAGCCGSCEIKAFDPTLHLMLNARILALAAGKGLEIVTVCDTCQANLLHTSRRLEADATLRESILKKLAAAGIRYEDTPRTRHLLAVLTEDIGLDTLRRQSSRRLDGLRVATFACCHAFRGPGASPGSRSMLDDMISATGATVVPVRTDGDCCGFHVLMVNEEVAARASGKFLTRCLEMQIDCVATTSPLCHTALDIYQHKVERVTGRKMGIPILHFEQLLALSLGSTPKSVGLERHLVSTGPLLKRIAA